MAANTNITPPAPVDDAPASRRHFLRGASIAALTSTLAISGAMGATPTVDYAAPVSEATEDAHDAVWITIERWRDLSRRSQEAWGQYAAFATDCPECDEARRVYKGLAYQLKRAEGDMLLALASADRNAGRAA